MSDDDLIVGVDPKDNPHQGPGFKVTECWIYVALDDSGGEGVLGESRVVGGREIFMPFFCTNAHTRDALHEAAVRLGRRSRMEVRLVRLTMREDLGVIWSPKGGRT